MNRNTNTDEDTDTDIYKDTNVILNVPVLPPLPRLVATPTAYSGSCLALSPQLIAYLQTLLAPPPCITVSIGSGFGLLEAYIMNGPDTFHIIGVEVAPSPNKYLPSSHHRLVTGTRFLEPLAETARIWLFVYPRRIGLIQEYMATYGQGAVERIIWAGPKADWDDYRACFANWTLQEQEADMVGGRAWELIVVADKKSI
ncbi:hypothetical protein COCMIDRAFT_96079 [Bipolaris oryzae ATCC 44560]|uniref:Uncharacterized protein n=1 Tax=Bipolaris oryzae ATCC 44560 TaxID=930090 RepID=W6Z0H9_COCMI|nr:uncharacterized protein COCMIDRAFT_96079 [Bipolaris oryzae ATCC 44560]EUC45252.1 hypothetical protein COCMIDRAFT_96079 [Bipolaris oryzae ATCC 44560]